LIALVKKADVYSRRPRHIYAMDTETAAENQAPRAARLLRRDRLYRRPTRRLMEAQCSVALAEETIVILASS
jgi:hypothetical protein